LPEYRDPNAKRLDLRSAALSIVAILSVVYGLKEMAQGGVAPLPVAAVVLGIVLGAIFVWRQLRIQSPMIDVRLFRVRALNASLVTYLLAIFTVVGYFLFVSQYFQLVLGFSPLVAAMWELPSAIGFIVGSVIAPRIIHRYRPAVIMGGGLALAAAGAVTLFFVTQDPGTGPLIVTFAMVVLSLALAPPITLATELIVGSAPPEQAGAATGISETSGELGGALGIAMLGSLGTVVYRSEVADLVPAGVPPAVLEAARDSLGGAVAVAQTLPAEIGAALVAAAQTAFVDAFHVVAAVSVVLSVATAIGAVWALRGVPKRAEEPETPAGAEAAEGVA
jgi:DHA2 family multidrug resistance protein-like MFS transporter